MKKHKDAIRHIRQEIKDLSAKKPEVRASIRELKYDPQGNRRPETGSQRSQLKQDYDYRVKARLRVLYTAYGLLRGRPYLAMERTCNEEISCAWVHRVIHEAMAQDEALKAEWPLDRVVSLIVKGQDILSAMEAAE